MSPLQALLIKEARVSRLIAGPWQGGLEHDECPDTSRIRLTFVRGAEGSPSTHGAFTLVIRPTESGIIVVENHTALSEEGTLKLEDQSVAAGLEQAIAGSVQQFNEKHRLEGHVRVRYWGYATDATGTYAAACITLHPSSMLDMRAQADSNPEHAIRRILCWVKAHSNDDNVKSELDIKLLRLWASLTLSEHKRQHTVSAQEAADHQSTRGSIPSVHKRQQTIRAQEAADRQSTRGISLARVKNGIKWPRRGQKQGLPRQPCLPAFLMLILYDAATVRFMVRSSSLQSSRQRSKQLPPRPSLKIRVPAPAGLSPSHSSRQPILSQEALELTNTSASTASSPVDPSYNPSTNGFRPNLPATPVSSSGGLFSFLNLDSSSDEETPVVEQASSGRVGKAQAVRYACHTKDSSSEEAMTIASHRAETLARLEGIDLAELGQIDGARLEEIDVARLEEIDPGPGKDETGDNFSFSKTPTDHTAAAGAEAARARDASSIMYGTIESSSSCCSTIKESALRTSFPALHLTLTLDRHPSATHDITIPLPLSPPPSCPPAVDDHALFTTIRRSYHTHLVRPIHRILTPRTLTHATISSGTCFFLLDSDSADFAAHLLAPSPSLGHSRTDWLDWLVRLQLQSQLKMSTKSNTKTTKTFNRRAAAWKPKHKHKRHSRITITLHHGFNLRAIALALVAVVLLAASSTVAWKRVLAALVLGFCVFVGGSVAMGLWIWAGWLLL
ncbi:hypothetical protein DV735_g4719, partial [Chaetothyriales sp. CBS 134920]